MEIGDKHFRRVQILRLSLIGLDVITSALEPEEVVLKIICKSED
jgi:hypothetical protein